MFQTAIELLVAVLAILILSLTTRQERIKTTVARCYSGGTLIWSVSTPNSVSTSKDGLGYKDNGIQYLITGDCVVEKHETNKNK